MRNYTKILQGGIWCIMRIEYRRPGEVEDEFGDDVFGQGSSRRPKKKGGKRGPEDSPFSVMSLTPIQMPNLDIDEFVSHRSRFTHDEWLSVLCALPVTSPTP